MAMDDYEKNIADVEMLEWAKGSSDTILRTDGLNPCIGIATFAPDTSIGHLAHFPVPHEDKSETEAFLASVAAHTQHVTDVNVWIRGSIINPDARESAPYSEASRIYVIKKVKELGIIHLNIDWNSDEGKVASIELDCETGECIAEIHDFTSLTLDNDDDDDEWLSTDYKQFFDLR